uniref:Iron-sulfur cluster carrier protein n=2 Tax=Candidatus Bipolaricaulota TaxID=67810 RepID=H5SHB5_9BACT|nr:ATPase [uncultured Acetothermia bacterium]BAL58954.1 ATP-binding protein involved in chromosome partitioning [Candidatus Acetothermum autotrophicum]
MDPRVAIIEERLKPIKRILAVAAGKGGVGKSTVATGLALILAQMGHRVGLLDLDFYGPSTHIILGVSEDVQPREERGIVPPKVHNIEFMSFVYYTGKNPTPLRGPDITNALIELLAITRWGELDFLIVDMPPGLGDTTLDAIRLLRNPSFLIVTTPSRVAQETVKRLLMLVQELKLPIVGIWENMSRPGASAQLLPCTGRLPFDETLEGALGDPERFLQTEFARRLQEITSSFSL